MRAAIGGIPVDISGTTLIAGYTWNIANESGVYIIERKGEEWEVLNHFPSPQPNQIDYFGHAVALNGNFAVIGAYEQGGKQLIPERGLLHGGPGRVYVYQRRGTGTLP